MRFHGAAGDSLSHAFEWKHVDALVAKYDLPVFQASHEVFALLPACPDCLLHFAHPASDALPHR